MADWVVVQQFFRTHSRVLQPVDFGPVAKACKLPEYVGGVLCRAFQSQCGAPQSAKTNPFEQFKTWFCGTFFQIPSSIAHRLLHLLTPPGRLDAQPADFQPLIQDILHTHPGLQFLQESPEFHARYVETVVARIFYVVNRSWSGRITAKELDRSAFIDALLLLEEEQDINKMQDFFSYEHFYVIYTSFWKLDTDHDLCINRSELARYGDEGLSPLALDRIFQGTVAAAASTNDMLSYHEFVYFILSEEDKTSPTAIEYWFRVMDLDGDGVISLYELEQFYNQQKFRLTELGMDALAFEDHVCAMLDLVHPTNPAVITLRDLKRCKQTSSFFNNFLNVNKFLDAEEKDPFQAQREKEELGYQLPSDWEMFARAEYDHLALEEENGDAWSQSSGDDDDDLWS
eukprot:m.50549 g.50549  ORF g.50549 m.50549 type:complete len:400 (+) comp15151_c1_seq1:199-1398(+)